jgi:hypothetical protein
MIAVTINAPAIVLEMENASTDCATAMKVSREKDAVVPADAMEMEFV